MSYTGNYITPIFNRTLTDVEEAKEHQELTSKGAYNYIDLNRIENNIRYVADDMFDRGITKNPILLNSKYDWNEKDVPSKEDISRIVGNILLLKSLSVEDLEWINFAYGTQINYSIANVMEKNIDNMLHQELPKPDEQYLEVINGSGTGYYVDKTIVPINANMPEQNMMFWKWSAEPNILEKIENIYASSTNFTVDLSYGEKATIEANYIGTVPHMLTIKDGLGSGRYVYGDIIDIQANDAPSGKVFYQWLGDFAKDNCVNYKASTTAFTMPNEEAIISSQYIYPGEHLLTVNGGSGGGYYAYDETVYVSGNAPSDAYAFSHWSGDTQYLKNPNSESSMLTMPDAKCTIIAHYTYVYGGPFNLNIADGSGTGEYMEGTSISIVAIPPNDSVGFVNWTKSGYGSIANVDASSTTFYMGRGEGYAIANMAPKHQITVNNGSGSGSYPEGVKVYISANTPPAGMIFDHWEGDTLGIPTKTEYVTYVMRTEDKVITAVYRNKNTYTVTVNNGSGSGEYSEKSVITITANDPETGYEFSHWSKSGSGTIQYSYNKSTSFTVGDSDVTLTPNYRALHNLTVVNGSGSGIMGEGTSRYVQANNPASGYRFSHWDGDTDKLSNPASSYTRFTMGNTDATITAVYELLPDLILSVNKGSGSGTYKSGSTIQIITNPAPDGYTFLTWVGDVDQVSDVFASTANVVGISKDTTITATYYIPENPEYFNLIVNNGYGSGSHAAGSEVSIQANYPLNGYEFWKWTGDISTVRDVRASETSMLMPAYAATITANYRPIGSEDVYTLTVNYGSGSGNYPVDEVVPIAANEPPNWHRFDKWLGDVEYVDELSNPSTTITIKNSDVVISASYVQMQKYVLEVIGGIGSGSYYEGQKVNIIANEVSTDDIHYEFVKWTGDTTNITDINSSDTILSMYPNDASIEAEYIRRYRLTINNGTGSGYFQENEQLQIQAREPEENEKFVKWIGDTSVLSNPYSMNPTLKMPNSVVTLTAVYTSYEGPNSIGDYSNELTENENILKENNIVMTSGILDVGTIIFDTVGNTAVCFKIDNDDYYFQRIFITPV